MRNTGDRVLEHGFHVLDLHRPEATIGEDRWFFGAGFPPSYTAHGRSRFVETVALAEECAPRSILEVAAGNGLLAACLYRPGRRIVVNDLRPIPLTHWKDGEQIENAPGNLFELDPKTLGTFDLVVACEVIEHVAHGKEFIEHLLRFVRPGGTLLVTTPNGEFVRSRLPTYSQITDYAALEPHQFKPDADGHLYLYTERELVDVLRGAGAASVDVRFSVTPFIGGQMAMRHLPRTRRFLPIYQGADRLVRAFAPSRRRLCSQLYALAKRA